MEIILQENFPQLGYVGDRVKVRPGFARNYLIPKGIAVMASSRQGNLIKHRISIINLKKAKLKKVAEELAERLQPVVLEFTLKAGSGGKTFGSVTSRDIEAELLAKGFELDRKQVRLIEPLKSTGEHKVEIKLHSEVVTQIAVVVLADKTLVKTPKRAAEQIEKEGAAASESGELVSAEAQDSKAVSTE